MVDKGALMCPIGRTSQTGHLQLQSHLAIVFSDCKNLQIQKKQKKRAHEPAPGALESHREYCVVEFVESGLQKGEKQGFSDADAPTHSVPVRLKLIPRFDLQNTRSHKWR